MLNVNIGSRVTTLALFLVLSAQLATADSNYVFYTVEKVKWGAAEHMLVLPSTFSSSPEMTASALASEAFNRLKLKRGADYQGTSLELDQNFAATGAARVSLGDTAKKKLAVVLSEAFWTLKAAGVREVRFPDVSTDVFTVADVPYGAASVVLQLWQLLPPGAPGPGLTRVGDKLLPSYVVRQKLDSKDKATLGAVFDLLQSPVPYVRRYVVKALAGMNLPRVEPKLIPLLTDTDASVKSAVLDVFKGTKSKKVLKALEVVVQEDPDPSTQSAAARILSAAGNQKYAMVVLYDKLKDRDDGVVMDAVQKLTSSGKSEVALALVDVLNHRSAEIRAMAMAGITASKNIDALRKVVESEEIEASLRGKAARALADGTGEDADRGLRYLLTSGELEPRLWAVGEVAKRRRYKLVPDVIGSLEHDNEKLRRAAAAALGTIKDSKALIPLARAITKFPKAEYFEAAAIAIFSGLSLDGVIRFSENENKTLRQLAIKSMGVLPPSPRVIQVLTKRLQDSDNGIKRSAAFALARIKDARVVANLVTLKDDPDAEIREQVAIAVTDSKHPQADTILLGYMQDTKVPVKVAAVNGLRVRKVSSALQQLKFQVRHPNVEVKRAVMHALVELSSDKEWDAFFQIWSNALFDTDADVKIWAVRGLARRKDPRLPVLFAPLVTDASDQVKIAALKALGSTGDPDAVEYITRGLLEAKANDVKLSALSALEALNTEDAKKAHYGICEKRV
ncbi:MAG: HEAT repeat domain-containing protein [Myxococcota bacterium]|nr:HEAT repeat domain-containing protein [Myxococcota bacterium]